MTRFGRLVSLIKVVLPRVGVLTLGSVLGQVILAVGFLLLTRAYSPAELGVLALLLSASRILEIGLSGRAGTMVSLHPSLPEADQIVMSAYGRIRRRAALSMAIAVVVSLLIRDLAVLAVSLPIFASIAAFEQLGVQLAIRRGDYVRAAAANLVRPFALIVAAGALTFVDGGAVRLILAAVFSRLVSLLALPKPRTGGISDELSNQMSSFSRKQVPIALSSTASLNLPQILVGALFGEAASGIYTLGYRVVAAPVLTVTTAIRQVLAREIAQRPGREATTVLRAALFTIPLGVVIVAGIVVLSRYVDRAFAESWSGVGAISAALAPLLGVRFAIGPLSQVLISLDRQRELLGWHAVNLVIVPASFLIMSQIGQELSRAVLVYSTAMSCSYIALALLLWKRLGRQTETVSLVDERLVDDPVGGT